MPTTTTIKSDDAFIQSSSSKTQDSFVESVVTTSLPSSSLPNDSSTFRSVSAAPIFYVETSSTSNFESSPCSERDQRGLKWPKTRSGTEAALRCPNNLVSMGRWACESGNWIGSWPDLSECESEWLRKLRKGIRKIGDLSLYTGELAGRVRSSPLYGGDILGILKVIAGLKGKRMGVWRMQDLLSTLSALLDKRSVPAWKDLGESLRKSAVEELMSVTEDLGGGFRRKGLSLTSDNIDIVVKEGHGSLQTSSNDEYFYFNRSSQEVGIRPFDLLIRKPTRSLVLTTFRNIHFLLHPLMISELRSVSLYEEGSKVNYEGGSVKTLFEGTSASSGSVCGVWNHVEWNRGLCHEEEGDSGLHCVCGAYSRIAVFSKAETPLMDRPGIRGAREDEDGLSQVTFIIVVVVTSIISVASLLSFTLIIIYCRRVKIQDKWDRSWYCRKRETDLPDTNTTSTSVALPLGGVGSASTLLHHHTHHHQMNLHDGGYSHPLFGGGEFIGATLNNRHHLSTSSRQSPHYGGVHTSKKTHKGGYQELCINPQYGGSQTLLGNSGGAAPAIHPLAHTMRRSDQQQHPGKRLNNSEDLILPRPRTSRSGAYHHPSSTSSSSAGGNQHIYMEVDPRYDGDSGFTEESSYDAAAIAGLPRRVPRHLPNSNSDELISDEILSSPRESSSRSSHSEDEHDFEAPLRSMNRVTSRRRVSKHRGNEAYLLSWQMNNTKKPRPVEKAYKEHEGSQDERDVFTITGLNANNH